MRAKNCGRTPVFENLESRQFLSSTISIVGMDWPMLRVTGDGNSNRIQVNLTGQGGDRVKAVVSVNHRQYRTTQKIFSVVIDACGGEDALRVVGTSLPPDFDVRVTGGEGDDRLVFITDGTLKGVIGGDRGNDTVIGLSTGGGGDYQLAVNGGPGNDKIQMRGTQGGWLSGDSGDDTIIGGTGDDVILGGNGNDVLYGGSSDIVLGGPGNNLFQ